MKDIPVIKGKFYIRRLIEEGEHEHQDFKYAISDARKIARSISAFANNDGGRLLVGVKDNGNIVGIPNEEDIYMIQSAAETYCIPPQDVDITAFKTEHGMVVLRASIPRSDIRPVYVKEADGKKVAYIRVKDENIVAHPLMVAAWELRQSDADRSLTLSDRENAILQYLREHPQSQPEEIALATHASAATTSAALTRLLAAGIISMDHMSEGFRISLADE